MRMKLKTKIIWISCLAVLSASLISDIAIWNICQISLTQETYETVYRLIYEDWVELRQQLDLAQVSRQDEDVVLYYLKEKQNDYVICMKYLGDGNTMVWKEIFNHTRIESADFVNELEQNMKSFGMMDYSGYEFEGKHYLVFRTSYQNYYYFYWITDISYLHRRLKQLALLMLAITGVLTVVVSLILYRMITRALKPLQELEVSAQAIAEGDYARRTQVDQQDEIGSLAEHFNQMAEAVEIRTRRIEESEQRKTLFMGNLTHELKTPLTAISGYADTMLMTKLTPSEEEEALSYIHSEADRLERLSRKMMQLLELDQRSGIEMEEHSVQELFAAAEQSCRQILRDKDIRLIINEHGERLRMDLDLMTDVMVNLVDNAVKASANGGEIILRAGTDEQGHTYLQVEDYGSGIPAEEQERILEPFYMVDKSRSRQHGGAGLGLALVKLILEHHGMQMKIESEVGVGTRISIYNMFTKR